ncbi:MAG: hypothetical protein RR619_10935, partial [Raoultibacter sp.]
LESIFGEKSSPHNEKSLSQMLSDAFKGLLPTSAQDNSALQQFANTDKVLDKKGIKDLPNTVEILVDNNTDFE